MKLESSKTLVLPFLISLVLIAGCKDEKIALPSADSTAPTAYWVVAEATSGKRHELPAAANPSLSVGSEKTITVAFHVRDSDGGVKRISINGGGLSACKSSSQADIASVECHDTGTLAADASGQVSVEISKGCSLDLSCKHLTGGLFPQVISGPGGTFRFSGAGENYFNGGVSSTITITTIPE